MGWLSGIGPWLIAAGGLGGLAAVLLVPGQLKKLRSEGDVNISGASKAMNAIALDLLKPAREEIQRVTVKMKETEDHCDQLKRTLDETKDQLEAANDQIANLVKRVEALTRKTTFLQQDNEYLRAQLAG